MINKNHRPLGGAAMGYPNAGISQVFASYDELQYRG